MVNIEITNLDKIITQLDKWEADIKELTRQVALGYSVKLFKAILVRSAQYSGDYAANWKYSVGSPDLSFDPGLFNDRASPKLDHTGKPVFTVGGSVLGDGPHRKAGDGEAVAYATKAAAGKASKFTLGAEIFISNSATHSEPYAWLIEDGTIKFRPGNAGHTVARAVDEMAKYETIDSNAAQTLRRESL